LLCLQRPVAAGCRRRASDCRTRRAGRRMRDCDIAGSDGRVLAEDVIAPVNVPPFDNSAVDGYAVRAANLDAKGETRLTIVGSRRRRA